ncbi:MAG: alpha/beta fold hydrolase [Candidatus Accumulibacter sp.]|uniref:YqiA/YcfP family alpha/beta fold hydrolase n=1 Tax=Accumulibacter sp. TaxID=2053492 RepID=UPI001A0BCC99|nr:YqiA/YcfP family alpha/beta fold hydrolase [Accumulibacter sp.]MBE2260818.1 alpha/beta fold hydrolase [Paracoccaceae bacterium]MCB1942800.1 alpha/beta fold hydrolase [Accumulibacter sp.]MCP5247260.1 alpha/beta fold hydrolase [Accumulibacter sp.]
MAGPRVVYLHGFCSSPASWKARLLGEALAVAGFGDRFRCPVLPPVPLAAIARVEALLADGDGPPTLVGSSLGGYYAAWLAEKHDLRAVLINPAVMAPALLGGLVGTQSNFHTGERFEFTAEHVEQLRALDLPQVTPWRYLLLVETGDEVLDYRRAVARYAGSRQVVVEGGDHSFTRFPEFVPQIIEFCGL